MISPEAIKQVLSFVEPKIEQHRNRQRHTQSTAPFVLGVSGLQGSGKSTWAESLASTLRQKHKYNVVVLSLDDLYHNHDSLIRIREADPTNGLQRTRGQPGTHDEELAKDFFSSLNSKPGEQIPVPSFDKSAFNGEGDRAPRPSWLTVTLPIDVLIFEGWCMGFHHLPVEAISAKWEEAVHYNYTDDREGWSTHTLSRHELTHLQAVNQNLKRYNETFMTPTSLDYLVHLDTDELRNVYRWRLQQEHALWEKRGSGMSDEEVVRFVQGYMPAYELYLDGLKREGFVKAKEGKGEGKTQLRVLLGMDREIVSVEEV